MLDARARRVLAPLLDRVAAVLDRRWITPNRITALGLLTGLGAAAAAAGRWWPAALVLWLASRVFDGLDGPLARRRSLGGAGGGGAFGGFADIVSDFAVYGAFIVGMAVGTGAYLPFLAVLLAYYVNGTAFLAFSSIAERLGRRIDDGRSLSFVGGLTEGTETIAAGVVFCLFPRAAVALGWLWAAAVTVTVVQRITFARRALTDPGERAGQ